jgi:hypothetical protein
MMKLLREYPLLSTTYHKASRTTDAAGVGVDPELLQEALAEQQRENKEALQKLLKQPSRFKKHDLGYLFTLKPGELEWLLQVFNDVRVGSWVKLGSPSPETPFGAEITEENIELAWAMEMAGLFEHTLLEAIDKSV